MLYVVLGLFGALAGSFVVAFAWGTFAQFGEPSVVEGEPGAPDP